MNKTGSPFKSGATVAFAMLFALSVVPYARSEPRSHSKKVRKSVGPLTGCTVSSNNVPTCPTPSGWTLVDAQGFESGSLNPGESFYGGSNSETISTANPHTGSRSMDTYVAHSYGGIGMVLSGSSINRRDTDASWWENVQQANPGHGIFYTDFYPFVRTGSATSLLADWMPSYLVWGTTQGQWTFFANGHSGYPNFALWRGQQTTMPIGQWFQIEAHLRASDPGSSNGVFDLWINGSLAEHFDNSSSSSSCPSNCGNFTRSVDISQYLTNIGGDWGAVQANGKNQNMAACAGGKYNGTYYTAQQVCPPKGAIPYFHIYIDDVIVLKK